MLYNAEDGDGFDLRFEMLIKYIVFAAKGKASLYERFAGLISKMSERYPEEKLRPKNSWYSTHVYFGGSLQEQWNDFAVIAEWVNGAEKSTRYKELMRPWKAMEELSLDGLDNIDPELRIEDQLTIQRQRMDLFGQYLRDKPNLDVFRNLEVFDMAEMERKVDSPYEIIRIIIETPVPHFVLFDYIYKYFLGGSSFKFMQSSIYSSGFDMTKYNDVIRTGFIPGGPSGPRSPHNDAFWENVDRENRMNVLEPIHRVTRLINYVAEESQLRLDDLRGELPSLLQTFGRGLRLHVMHQLENAPIEMMYPPHELISNEAFLSEKLDDAWYDYGLMLLVRKGKQEYLSAEQMQRHDALFAPINYMKSIVTGSKRLQEKKLDLFIDYMNNRQDYNYIMDYSNDQVLGVYDVELLLDNIDSPMEVARMINENVDPFIESLYRDDMPAELYERNTIIIKAYIFYLRSRDDYTKYIKEIEELNLEPDEDFAGIDTYALVLGWGDPLLVQQILLDDFTKKGVRVDLLHLLLNDSAANEVLKRQADYYAHFVTDRDEWKVSESERRILIPHTAIRLLKKVKSYTPFIWGQTATALRELGYTDDELFIGAMMEMITLNSPIHVFAPERSIDIWYEFGQNYVSEEVRELDQVFINLSVEARVYDPDKTKSRIQFQTHRYVYILWKRYQQLSPLQGVANMINVLGLYRIDVSTKAGVRLDEIYFKWTSMGQSYFITRKPADHLAAQTIFAMNIEYMAKNDGKLIPFSHLFKWIFDRKFDEQPDRDTLIRITNTRLNMVRSRLNDNQIAELTTLYSRIANYYNRHIVLGIHVAHFGFIDMEQRLLSGLGLTDYVSDIMGLEPFPKLKPIVLEFVDDVDFVLYQQSPSPGKEESARRALANLIRKRRSEVERYYYTPQRGINGGLYFPEWEPYAALLQQLSIAPLTQSVLEEYYDDEAAVLEIKNMDDVSERLVFYTPNAPTYNTSQIEEIRALKDGEYIRDPNTPPAYEIVKRVGSEREHSIEIYSLIDETNLIVESNDVIPVNVVKYIVNIVLPTMREIERPPSFYDTLMMGSAEAGPAEA